MSVGELGSIEARLSYKCLLVLDERLSAGAEIPVTNRNGTVNAIVR